MGFVNSFLCSFTHLWSFIYFTCLLVYQNKTLAVAGMASNFFEGNGAKAITYRAFEWDVLCLGVVYLVFHRISIFLSISITLICGFFTISQAQIKAPQ